MMGLIVGRFCRSPRWKLGFSSSSSCAQGLRKGEILRHRCDVLIYGTYTMRNVNKANNRAAGISSHAFLSRRKTADLDLQCIVAAHMLCNMPRQHMHGPLQSCSYKSEACGCCLQLGSL